jgi:hypothetical protein
MFENKVLRRIFGRNRDEVTTEWRKMHSEELHILHSDQIKENEVSGDVVHMGEGRTVYRVLMEKPQGKRPLGRMDLTETVWGYKWIHLGRDRGRWWAVVNTVMNLRVLGPRS